MTNSIQKLFSLEGRTVLITGGSRGLGKAIARGFALSGAEVLLAARSEESMQEALPEITKGCAGQGACFKADLSSREGSSQLADEVLERYGTVDVFLHCAGSNVREYIPEIQDSSWDRIIELNLASAMVLTRRLAPQMARVGWGRLIYIASMLAHASREQRASYAASKAGLVGFMRSAAQEFGPRGITANCISPGPIATELTTELQQGPLGREYSERLALRRWGTPQDLQGPALLLASKAGAFITGQSLIVDGGALSRAV